MVKERRKEVRLVPNWVRQSVTVGLILTVVLCTIPVVLSPQPLTWNLEDVPTATLPKKKVESEDEIAMPSSQWDKEREIKLLRGDGTVDILNMEEYLWGVVAAEMPASFHVEALKAQAVAARTYTATKQESLKHETGMLCDDSTCCQAYVDREVAVARWGLEAKGYIEKIQTAVAMTDSLGILYEDEPIEALFFASAAGQTVDAVEVWGNSVDYLVGVDSPEGTEVPNYHSEVTLKKSEVERIILEKYPGSNLGKDFTQWIGDVSITSSGSVSSLNVGGVVLTGGQVRTLFGLRSASFTYKWEGETLIFDVTGHGHGVGMSQYGANTMAKEGNTFQEILTWYYTGTEVKSMWGAG